MNIFWMKTLGPSNLTSYMFCSRMHTEHYLSLSLSLCVYKYIYMYTLRTHANLSWLSHFVYCDIDPLGTVHGYDRHITRIHSVDMVAMIYITSMDL